MEVSAEENNDETTPEDADVIITNEESTEQTEVEEATETVTEEIDTVTLIETIDLGQEYIDKFIFLGDSTTYALDHYDIIPFKQVWTPASGTLDLSKWSVSTVSFPNKTSWAISDAAAEIKPEYLLITLGVNGVSHMNEAYFTAEYTSLVTSIQEASPDTKLY